MNMIYTTLLLVFDVMEWLEVKQRVKKTLSIKVYPLLFLVLPNRQIKSVWIPRKFMRLVAAFMNMIIHLCTFIIITWCVKEVGCSLVQRDYSCAL